MGIRKYSDETRVFLYKTFNALSAPLRYGPLPAEDQQKADPMMWKLNSAAANLIRGEDEKVDADLRDFQKLAREVSTPALGKVMDDMKAAQTMVFFSVLGTVRSELGPFAKGIL